MIKLNITLLIIASFLALTYAGESDFILEFTIRDFKQGHPAMQVSHNPGYTVNDLGSFNVPTVPSGSDHPTDFHQFWVDVPGVNINLKFNWTFTFVNDFRNLGPGWYFWAQDGFETQHNFFPIDDQGWLNEGHGHNYHFTSHLHAQFEGTGQPESISTISDDDVLVFVDGIFQPHLSIPGKHPPYVKEGQITPSVGTHTIDFFHAERHLVQSAFTIFTTFPMVQGLQDSDQDGIFDHEDNCPLDYNPDQLDCNGNLIGDVCETFKGGVGFPFADVISDNINEDFDYAVDVWDYETLLEINTDGREVNLLDTVPEGSMPSHVIRLNSQIFNEGSENCQVTVEVNPGANSGDARQILAIRGVLSSSNTSDPFYSLTFPTSNEAGVLFWNYDGNNVIRYTADCPDVYLGTVEALVRWTNYEQSYPCAGIDCGRGTFRFGGFCACWSGSWGRYCNNFLDDSDADDEVLLAWEEATMGPFGFQEYTNLQLDVADMAGRTFFYNWPDHPTCPISDWVEIGDLQTVAPPVLEDAGFIASNLFMRVSSPMTVERAESTVYLNEDNDDFINDHPDCVYPISTFIHKEVLDCLDIWYFDIPWKIASKCGWTIEQQDTHEVWKGQVIVRFVEFVVGENPALPINEWRFTRSVLRIKLRFQKFVSVESTIETFNSAEYAAAITQQIVAVDIDGAVPATIELVTLTEWPFRLTGVSFSSYPTDKVTGSVLTETPCAGADNVPCKQRWLNEMSLDPDACDIDGSYTLSYIKDCLQNYEGECPIQGEPETSIDYILDSEDFCAEITVEIGLTGEIKSYEDEQFLIERGAFIEGDRTYWLVTVDSELNQEGEDPVILFDDTTVFDVQVTPDGSAAFLLVDRGNIVDQPDGSVVDEGDGDLGTDLIIYDRIPGNEVGFSFILSDRLVATLQPNSQLRFTISAVVKVDYADGSVKRNAYFRAVFGDDNSQTENTYTADLGIDGGNTGDDDTADDDTMGDDDTADDDTGDDDTGDDDTGDDDTGDDDSAFTLLLGVFFFVFALF